MYRKFLLAPDKFKGTFHAEELCELLSEAVLNRFPNAEIRAIPMTDGGEGMTNAYLRIRGGREERVVVTGPDGNPVEATYGILTDGTGVAEMSAAAGLARLTGAPDPLNATTAGVGEMLLAMRRAGAKRILLGIGGSATNDCGVGMAAAMGWKFFDEFGSPVEPKAKNLFLIEHIERPETPFGLEVTAACAVANPLWGPEGATLRFGDRKGAIGETADLLEVGIRHFAAVLARELDAKTASLRGAGSGGGLGAGAVAFLNAELCPGAGHLIESANFREFIKNSDIVITGEGRLDGRSANGKVVAEVGHCAKEAGIPCIALCGCFGPGAEELYGHGVTGMFSAVNGRETLATKEDILLLADNVLRLLEV